MGKEYINIHKGVIARCLQGDRQAHNELYNLYSRAMYNTCYRIVNNKDDAEDVLQDAFISAFRNLRSYKGEAAFGAWLKRIVVNRAINFIKKKQLVIEEIAEVAVEEEVEYHGPYSIESVKKAIDRLPDGYRLVFSLYLLEGYDHSEIAMILGITESTSKSQFNRAKRKVKQLLQEEVNYERPIRKIHP